MEVFSLEDDYGDMFITQSGGINTGDDNSSNNSVQVLPYPMDFSSPCVSLTSSNNVPQYSDISDDEDFQIPPSQMQIEATENVPK